jgi:hypothetical protein
MGFKGVGPFRVPSSTEALANLDLRSEGGKNLGTVKQILHSKWINKRFHTKPEFIKKWSA